MFQNVLENVRKKCPLIHNITNYVTANDCANVVLACGASPIMADEKDEVADITAICAGLNINMGTISKPKIESMLIAGKKANELHHPIVLDPVGVGTVSYTHLPLEPAVCSTSWCIRSTAWIWTSIYRW